MFDAGELAPRQRAGKTVFRLDPIACDGQGCLLRSTKSDSG